MLTLPKSKFESHNAYAAEKYTLLSKDVPFVGDRIAKYKAGDVQVWLNAPHMSIDVVVMFMHDSFVDAFQSGRQARMNEMKSKEISDFFGD